MTVALTYDGTLARVRIAVTAIPAAADYVKIERSVDQIQWKTVRGGTAIPLVAGAANLDDYEWSSGVVNYYRVSAVDTSPITFVAVGTAIDAVNASVTPGLPAGRVAGDALYMIAAIRNSGAGTPDTPAGWTRLKDFSSSGAANAALFGRFATNTAADQPTVTFTGGVALADTAAQMVAFRNASIVPATSAGQLNGSAQNIDYPALTVPGNNHLVLVGGWRQSGHTGVATLAGMTEIGDFQDTAGDDQGVVWDYQIQTAATNISAGSFVVTGGAAAISRSISAAFSKAPFLQQETANITPTLTTVWLKSLARPFLNRAVTVTDFSEVTRPSRSEEFEVAGRSAPVVVSEVRGSRRWSIDVKTETLADAREFDLILASGDLQFVHTPANCPVPGGYVVVKDTTERRLRPRGTRRIFTLPLVECAAPGADVVGGTYTCQGVLNDYATTTAVIAANATIAILLDRVGSPSDVLVP